MESKKEAMRTEQQVREAFTSIADQAPSPAAALSRLRLEPPPRFARRRRTVVALAAAAVVIALAVALPSLLINRTGEPADQRVPGNWNMIHRVDPPDGWIVVGMDVWPDHEVTLLGRPGSPSGCAAAIYGVGALKRLPTERQPITVRDSPGFYAPKGSDDGEVRAGIYWQYRPDGWAVVSCGEEPSKSDAVLIAERVVFASVPMRVPFRLRSSPDGMQVGVLSTGWDGIVQFIGVSISRTREPDELLAYVDFGPAKDAPEPGLPGVEQITINGRLATLRADNQTLCFAVPERSLCVRVGRDDRTANPDLRRWEPGARELVIHVAERLELASNPADSATWFDANEALNS
jgi:hypothetical protein